VARVLCMVDDLMLQSRVTETLRSAGHEVVTAQAEVEGLGVELIVADLDAVAVETVGAMEPPKLGFCRHTDVAAREAAEEAGFDRVVPRSRMARELPELVDGLLDR
jgi:hypothetical protein